MSDDRPRNLAPDATGDLQLTELVTAAADGVEVGKPDGHAPTLGRVLEDSETDQVWLGDGSAWQDVTHNTGLDVAGLPGVQVVRSADDLPDASGGVRTLEDGTAYLFADFVSDPATLRLGDPSPLLGRHGGTSGYIHTGGSTAIKANGEPFFARNAYFHAPGGTAFDLTADNTTEMLVESVSLSDAVGLGNIASLGTITGYRVPSFKGCSFEDFDGGLTFDGSPDKIFVEGSPFRGVTASNVSCLTLADTCDVNIVDFPSNYFKDVQSDTEMWRVEAGGEPNEVFQYRGNTHDTSVTKSNILTGPNAGLDREPFWVTQSYPLRDTAVVGEMHNDGEGTVTISTTDTFTDVDVPSTQDTTKRFVKDSEGHQKYVGSSDSVAQCLINVSFYGANGDIYTFGISQNGNAPLEQHKSSVEAGGKNANVALPINATFTLEENDIIHFKVKNETAANDATISSYSFTITGN